MVLQNKGFAEEEISYYLELLFNCGYHYEILEGRKHNGLQIGLCDCVMGVRVAVVLDEIQRRPSVATPRLASNLPFSSQFLTCPNVF